MCIFRIERRYALRVSVIPAEAGIQATVITNFAFEAITIYFKKLYDGFIASKTKLTSMLSWIPASAGMTPRGYGFLVLKVGS